MSLKQRQRAERREAERKAAEATSNIQTEELELEIQEEIDPSETTTEVEILENDPYEVLKREYEELKAQRDEESAKFEALKLSKEREKAETETRAYQAELERRDLEARVNELASNEYKNHGAIIYHALAAAKAEAEQAQHSYAMALQIGDAAEAAVAQRRLVRAETNILRLEDGQQALEAQPPQPPQERQPQFSGRVTSQSALDPIEAQISKYTPSTQNWLRTHKADIFSSQQRQDFAYAGHVMAVNAGNEPDTQAYWDYLDTHMGYKTPVPVENTTPSQSIRPPMPRPSAPVTRSDPIGRPSQVYATKEDKETARELGMSVSRYVELKNKIAKGEAGKLRFDPV